MIVCGGPYGIRVMETAPQGAFENEKQPTPTEKVVQQLCITS